MLKHFLRQFFLYRCRFAEKLAERYFKAIMKLRKESSSSPVQKWNLNSIVVLVVRDFGYPLYAVLVIRLHMPWKPLNIIIDKCYHPLNVFTCRQRSHLLMTSKGNSSVVFTIRLLLSLLVWPLVITLNGFFCNTIFERVLCQFQYTWST